MTWMDGAPIWQLPSYSAPQGEQTAAGDLQLEEGVHRGGSVAGGSQTRRERLRTRTRCGWASRRRLQTRRAQRPRERGLALPLDPASPPCPQAGSPGCGHRAGAAQSQQRGAGVQARGLQGGGGFCSGSREGSASSPGRG
ncbi:unnamed protein product [Rangifer tarandus platyrhynchus]|uniref:Uncharacterized protein n=1 Tax=Rangifer tarandus platyrhynchus TaxID=3082113 RepID=A0AC59ZG17_RANTA